MPEQKVSLLLELLDGFSKPAKKATGVLGGFTKILKRIAKAAALAQRGISTVYRSVSRGVSAPVRAIGRLSSSFLSLRTLLVGAFLVSVTTAFGQLEEGVLKVATLSEQATRNIERNFVGVQRVAIDLGQASSTVAEALFDSESAGVLASKSLDFTRKAAELATAGFATTSETIQGLTAALGAYNLEADDAGRVADILFAAQEKGRTTIGRLSTSFGNVAPIARELGIDIETVAAALARLTKVAPNTEQAATSLKSLFAQLSRADVRERLASAGVIIADDTFRSATGLVDVLRQLREATGGSATGFTALIPEMEAFQAASILAADDASDFIDILGRVRSSGGAVDRALEVALSGTLVRFRRTREALKSVLAELGAAAKPVLDEVADGTRGLLEQLAGFIRRNRTEVAAFLTAVRDRVVAFHDFVVAVFSTGATGEALSNAFGSAIRVGSDILIAGIPVLGKAAALVGRQIARQLFESFFREGQASLFTVAERLGAIGRDVLKFAGGGPVIDAIEKIEAFERSVGSDLPGATLAEGKALARQALDLADQLSLSNDARDRILSELGSGSELFSLLGGPKGEQALRDSVGRAVEVIRSELRKGDSGRSPLTDALAGDISDIKAATAAFGETVKGSLKREVDGFGSTLAPDVRRLWDQIFVDTLPQRRLERAVQALSPAVRAAFDQIVSREGIDSTERQTTLALGLLRIDQARLKVTESVTAALTRQATAQAPDGGADPAKAFQGADAAFKRVERALDDAQRAQQAYSLGIITAEERVRRFAAAESELAIATGLVGGDLAAAAAAFPSFGARLSEASAQVEGFRIAFAQLGATQRQADAEAAKGTSEAVERRLAALQLLFGRYDITQEQVEAGLITTAQAESRTAATTKALAEELASAESALRSFAATAGADTNLVEGFAQDIDAARVATARIQQEAQGFGDAFERGFSQAVKAGGDFNRLGADLGATFADGLGGIVDLFIDGTQSFAEFSRTFLVGIAKMIAKALLFKAIGSVFGLGFSEGGEVPRLGFASGGAVPGPNVRRDIVPANLMPREHVMPVDSVDFYSRRFMHAVQHRLFPRELASAYMGGSGASAVAGRGGFASGGEVSGTPAGGIQSPGVAAAAVVPNESAMARMLAGGGKEFLDFIEDNAPGVRGRLGVSPS